MKIFGYEIKKIPKIKKVILNKTTYAPRIEITLNGDGWEFSDHVDFLPLITSHFNSLSDEHILPAMTNEQKVHIMKIFYKEICEFEVI